MWRKATVSMSRSVLFTGEHPVQAAGTIDVDVTALEVAHALLRIVRRSAVQDAVVCKDLDVARAKDEPGLERWVAEQLGQPSTSGLVVTQLILFEQRQVIELGAVVEPGDPACRVPLDHGAVGAQVDSVVLEAELHRRR